MEPLLQISPDQATDILSYGNSDITGFGVALFVSLSFNFILWYELRSVHTKFIDHLKSSDQLLSKIHESIISKK